MNISTAPPLLCTHCRCSYNFCDDHNAQLLLFDYSQILI